MLKNKCAGRFVVLFAGLAAGGLVMPASAASGIVDDRLVVDKGDPLTETADMDRLTGWKVEVDGQRVSNATVSFVGGKLQVCLHKGLCVIIR